MISRFQGEHAFLSNFHPVIVWFDGQGYPSVEHAYQAAKTSDGIWKWRIRTAKSAGEAKRMGRKAPLKSGWNEMRLEVMEELLRAKFAHEDLREMLLATHPQRLIEGNWWGDRFWGVCDGEGENHLGRLLMEIRNDLNEFRTPKLDEEHVQWCRNLFAMLREDAMWGVPRSGLIFIKRNGALHLSGAVLPTAESLQDLEGIREHFGAAGIEVHGGLGD